MSTTEKQGNLAVIIAELLSILGMQTQQVIEILCHELKDFGLKVLPENFGQKEEAAYESERWESGTAYRYHQTVNLQGINELKKLVNEATEETVRSISFLVLNKIWDFECDCGKRYNPKEVMDLYVHNSVEFNFAEPCVPKENQGLQVCCKGFCAD
jgi:hypothetical protein